MHPWYVDGFLCMGISVAVAAVAFFIAGRHFDRALHRKNLIFKQRKHKPMPDELKTLIERERYLRGRAALKKSVDWDYKYDEREANALAWAISQLKREGIVTDAL